MGYKVVAHVMDVIEDDAGYFSNGQPKKITELHRGDDVPVDKIDELRLKELVSSGAVVEEKDEQSTPPQPGQAVPPAGAATAAKATKSAS